MCALRYDRHTACALTRPILRVAEGIASYEDPPALPVPLSVSLLAVLVSACAYPVCALPCLCPALPVPALPGP